MHWRIPYEPNNSGSSEREPAVWLSLYSGVIGGWLTSLTEKEKLAKEMQKTCGVGGTVKEGRIEIQGDKREDLGLGAPEDLRLIPSGQNLYCLDFTFNQLLKVPAGNFAAFVGDILVVDEGRGCALAGLYIVHWEGGRFVVRQIPIATAELEHVSFAPF